MSKDYNVSTKFGWIGIDTINTERMRKIESDQSLRVSEYSKKINDLILNDDQKNALINAIINMA